MNTCLLVMGIYNQLMLKQYGYTKGGVLAMQINCLNFLTVVV